MSTAAIEKFLMRPEEGGAYTDERLAMLLAHAQDGKLVYVSCCCLLGAATANHPLRQTVPEGSQVAHYQAARLFPNAREAEEEFLWLGLTEDHRVNDKTRRARLIPLIITEQERRSRLIQVTRDTRDSEVTHELAGVFN